MLKSRLLLVFALALAGPFALGVVGPGAARAAAVDPLVPADTQGYLAINVKSILDTPVFKTYLTEGFKQLLGETPEVNTIFGDLGFDPKKDLDRILFAMPGGDDTDRGLVIAHGTFDEAKFTKRAEDAARDNDDVFKIHKVALGAGKTHPVWEVIIPGQDTSIFVALVNNKMLVASPGKDYVVDALKQHRAKKKVVLKHKEFQAILEKLDAKPSISIAVLGKSFRGALRNQDILPQGVTDALEKIEAIGGSLTVTNEVKLELAVASKDARSAESIRNGLDRSVKIGMVGLALLTEGRKDFNLLLEIVKTIKVSGKGKVVGVSARLTADVLEDFFKKDE